MRVSHCSHAIQYNNILSIIMCGRFGSKVYVDFQLAPKRHITMTWHKHYKDRKWQDNENNQISISTV